MVYGVASYVARQASIPSQSRATISCLAESRVILFPATESRGEGRGHVLLCLPDQITFQLNSINRSLL